MSNATPVLATDQHSDPILAAVDVGLRVANAESCLRFALYEKRELEARLETLGDDVAQIRRLLVSLLDAPHDAARLELIKLALEVADFAAGKL